MGLVPYLLSLPTTQPVINGLSPGYQAVMENTYVFFSSPHVPSLARGGLTLLNNTARRLTHAASKLFLHLNLGAIMKSVPTPFYKTTISHYNRRDVLCFTW